MLHPQRRQRSERHRRPQEAAHGAQEGGGLYFILQQRGDHQRPQERPQTGSGARYPLGGRGGRQNGRRRPQKSSGKGNTLPGLKKAV